MKRYLSWPLGFTLSVLVCGVLVMLGVIHGHTPAPVRLPWASGSVQYVEAHHRGDDCGHVPAGVIPGHVIARRHPAGSFRFYGDRVTSAALAQLFTKGAPRVFDTIGVFCR